MNWHLAALTAIRVVSDHLIGHFLKCETTPQEARLLPVLREYQVSELHIGCRSHDRGLLSLPRHVEADPSLSLRLCKYPVALVDLDHGLEHFCKLFWPGRLDVLFDIRVLVDDLTVLIKHSEALELLAVALEFKLIVELVAEQNLVLRIHRTK